MVHLLHGFCSEKTKKAGEKKRPKALFLAGLRFDGPTWTKPRMPLYSSSVPNGWSQYNRERPNDGCIVRGILGDARGGRTNRFICFFPTAIGDLAPQSTHQRPTRLFFVSVSRRQAFFASRIPSHSENLMVTKTSVPDI